MRKRGSLLAGLVVAAALAIGGTAQAAVTIGSNLGTAANSNSCGGTDCTTTNLALTNDVAPNGLRSPVNGTVTSWRFKSGSNGNTVSLRVLRPGAGVAFTGVATSASVISATALEGPFATSLPIQLGDAIGLNASNGAIVLNTNAGGSQLYWTMPQLGNGETRDGTLSANQEVLVQATVEPTNTVTFGAVTRNKKKGTATLTVNVPNAGQLAYSGVGVNIAGPASVANPGEIQLTIKATGKKRKKLNLKGKVSVTPTVTFTPNNGTAATLSTTVQLKKKLKKKL